MLIMYVCPYYVSVYIMNEYIYICIYKMHAYVFLHAFIHWPYWGHLLNAAMMLSEWQHAQSVWPIFVGSPRAVWKVDTNLIVPWIKRKAPALLSTSAGPRGPGRAGRCVSLGSGGWQNVPGEGQQEMLISFSDRLRTELWHRGQETAVGLVSLVFAFPPSLPHVDH